MKPAKSLDQDFYMNIGYLLRRTSQIAAADFDLSMKEFGLTSPQYGILVVLAAHSGIDQAQLGKAMGFDRTMISYLVRRMEQKALLKTLKDPADRRSNVLVLTSQGKLVLQQAKPIAYQSLARLTGGLSAADIGTLRRILNDVLSSHDAQGQEPSISETKKRIARRLEVK